MGQVTMDLSELDKLRKDRQDAINEKEAKIEEIQKLKQEIVSVKSDKRTIRVTEYFENNHYETSDLRNYSSNIAQALLHNSRLSHYVSYSEIEDSVKYALRGVCYSTPTLKREEKVDFINFEDVKDMLCKELEKKYQSELVELRNLKTNYEKKIKEESIANEEKINELNKGHVKRVKELTEKQIQLEKDLDAAVNDKDTRKREKILSDKIDELKKEIEKQKNKGFFRRLLNL